MKVMIVDDDPAFADELADILQDAGYAVETFADGVTALNGVRRMKPAVILLDIKMDDFTGSQLAWHLRTFPETAMIPIIGMSGHADDTDPVQIAAAYGMNAFLKKPFPPLEIISRIEQLTDARPEETGPETMTVALAPTGFTAPSLQVQL